ncbi:MAG: HD domain-containing protein [Saprospiraceae bacterium]
MINKNKILNDPVYGFVNIPYGIIFDLVEHPYFQRLRRIKQTSLTHYVYPGALHTRFHHALGALHLTMQAIDVLCSKGVAISPQEAEALQIAVLLHDIGHGPFSHTLEHTLINVHHEDLSVLFMQRLNEIFNNKLDTAMQIFLDEHPKKFLHQLVSGQLDMDRMDYLNRDSFFTGVHEGVIGYDRIIKMLDVRDGELVVEEKGIYSVEKFLIARRLMYWQVYLHKTVLAAEQMLVQTLKRAKALIAQGIQLEAPKNLLFFLQYDLSAQDFKNKRDELLDRFATLDDNDIVSALKSWSHAEDQLLAYFANSLLNRRLFKVELRNEPFDPAYVHDIRCKAEKWGAFPSALLPYLVFQGKETNSAYTTLKDEIKILHKDGSVLPMSANADFGIQSKIVTKYYLCYPKELLHIDVKK